MSILNQKHIEINGMDTRTFLEKILPKQGVYQCTARSQDGKWFNKPAKSIDELVKMVMYLDSKSVAVYHACASFHIGDNRKADNAAWMRSIWLDVDVAKPNDARSYDTQMLAITDLGKMLKTYGLPKPMIVKSGAGLHLYWVLNQDINKVQWERITNSFAKALDAVGFKHDPSRTSDAASVLRPIGTKNIKHNNIVELLADAPEFDVSIFDDIVEEFGNPSKLDNPKNNVVQFPFSDDLGAGLTTTSNFEQNETNIKDFKSACEAVYPNGIVTRGDFIAVCFACAGLHVVHEWDESVAKAILDEVASKPENADRTNNETEWINALKGTKERFARGEVIAGHGAIMKRANELGWKPTVIQNPAVGDALAHLQKKFCLINISGDIRCIDRQNLSARNTSGFAVPLNLSNKPSALILLNNWLSKNFPDAGAKTVIEKFYHGGGTTIFDGVDFNPKPHRGSEALNLWVPHTVIPKAGTWPVLEDFLRNIICDGSQTSYDYLIKYLAHALQRPQEKPGVMIVLLGGQGVGKGTFSNILKNIWKATFLKVSDVNQIIGNFNAPLERAFWVFMDEALFAGDRKSSDRLKSLITEEDVLINQKNQPARQTNSVHRIVAATNADHFKNTEADDRRDFVLRVSSAKKDEKTYWPKVNSAIQGDELAALANDLMVMDLNGFDVRVKPNTGELLKQKISSLSGFDSFWFGCLCDGRIVGEKWGGFVDAETLVTKSNIFNYGQYHHRPISNREIKAKLMRVCPSATSERQGRGAHQKRGYIIPDLAKCRSDFCDLLGGRINWEDFE